MERDLRAGWARIQRLARQAAGAASVAHGIGEIGAIRNRVDDYRSIRRKLDDAPSEGYTNPAYYYRKSFRRRRRRHSMAFRRRRFYKRRRFRKRYRRASYRRRSYPVRRRYFRRRYGLRGKLRRRLTRGSEKASGSLIRFARWAGDVQPIYPQKMMAKLANTAWMQFIPNSTGGNFTGLSSTIVWNSFRDPGSHPNDIHSWVGQNTLGRIYRRYRIINALTKFTFVPMVVVNNTSTITRYRGDVYFYVVQTDSSVDPVWNSANTEFVADSHTAQLDYRTVAQIPGIKIKRRRWAEVPQSCSMTMLNTMPQSTKVAKNPAYSNDKGDYAGTITVATATYADPTTTLHTHFGFFIPTAIAYTVGNDYPTFKMQFKDITLCSYTDISPDAGNQ